MTTSETSGYANNSVTVAGVLTADVTDTTSTKVITGHTGKRIYITDVILSNSHATQGTIVKILSGSTQIWMGPAGPAYSGSGKGIESPVAGFAGDDINVQCVTTGVNVRAAISGYLSDY